MTGLQLSGKLVLEELTTGEILAQQKQLWIMERYKPRVFIPFRSRLPRDTGVSAVSCLSQVVPVGMEAAPGLGPVCQQRCALSSMLSPSGPDALLLHEYQEKHSLHIKYRTNLGKISIDL